MNGLVKPSIRIIMKKIIIINDKSLTQKNPKQRKSSDRTIKK
jgi:hypothetical protein